MRSTLLRWLSALLAGCLLLSSTALTEEMPEAAEAVAEDWVIVEAAEAVAEDAVIVEAAEDIAAEAVEASVAETEAELADDPVLVLEDEAIELAETRTEPAAQDAVELAEDPEAIEELPKAAEDEAETREMDSPLPTDGDALFTGYVRGLFGLNAGKLYASRLVGNDLTGEQKALYNFLKGCVSEIAAGKRSSTECATAHGYSLSWEQIYHVITCLIADCPYDMYWYGNHIQIQKSGGRLSVLFAVSDGYALDEFHVNAASVAAATNAANNARAIVNRNASKSDYDKLAAYRDEICGLVSYNDQAVSGIWPESDMDPWQLVWVFDGDSATNVVCEGYAKAFQYLCDITHFSGNVMCYCVTGAVNGGLHKWNIVRMPNGRNYHVDITWCDNSFGREKFFMKAPASGSVSNGYTFNGKKERDTYYWYDADCLSMYTTGDLRLSSGDYLNEINLKAAVTVPKSMKYSVNVGDSFQIDLNGVIASGYKSSRKAVATVNSSGMVETLAAGKTRITIKIGKKKRTLTLTVVDPTIPGSIALDKTGTIRWYRQDALTLKATLPAGTTSPITWKSSNKKVATVSGGALTFKKAGSVTITATATRGKKKAKVKIKVVDGSRATSIKINAPATTTLAVGQTMKLTAAATIARPADPNNPTLDPAARWSSSNSRVLSVNRITGEVTAKKPGSAVITVTAGSKKKAKVKFKVSK